MASQLDDPASRRGEVHDAVRARYAEAASPCRSATRPRRPDPSARDCCGAGRIRASGSLLYADADRASLPDAAVLACLGCGNPTAVAELREGETVLDLGSGGGIDVLLSARRVGPTGRAIGVDMTDEMLALARRNAAEAGATNVEFRKGTIEDIPLARRLGGRRHQQLRHQPRRPTRAPSSPRSPASSARAAGWA